MKFMCLNILTPSLENDDALADPEGLNWQVELPGCKGIWTVYHKSSRSHAVDSLKSATEDNEYHAYLIISLETRTMVLESADDLGEVTESVDYYVQGSTIAAGNLFRRRRVVQIFARGARILDGSYMTQELNFSVHKSDSTSSSETPTASSVSIADPYVLVKMSDGSIFQLLVGDLSTCTVSINVPSRFASLSDKISSCTLYHDKGSEPYLRKASSDAWLSTGITEAIDGNDGSYPDQGDVYCLVCYESGTLEIFDVPNFKPVFSVDKFTSSKSHIVDKHTIPSKTIDKSLDEAAKKEPSHNLKLVELVMHRWSGQYSRPFLFGLLNDGTMLCYHAYLYEVLENVSKSVNGVSSGDVNGIGSSRLRNLRFLRISLDVDTREELSNINMRQRISLFKNVGGYQGLFLIGSRPARFMLCKERLRTHPQVIEDFRRRQLACVVFSSF